MKVSVIIPTHRPGYMDTISQALKAQTLPREDWELILVDELYELRKDIVKPLMDFNFQHIPQPLSEKQQGQAAINLGLKHAKGELIYFMCDYSYPHSGTLERHWEIYERYGPKVFISGPFIDGITITGQCTWSGAQPVLHRVMTKDKGPVDYYEHIPPISLELKPDYDKPTPENLISIFKNPFKPLTWKTPPDWRIVVISNISVAKNLYECKVGHQWWWTRNDSVCVRDLEGMPEGARTVNGVGTDTLMISKLVEKGYRYLADRESPSYVLPHPWRKTLG